MPSQMHCWMRGTRGCLPAPAPQPPPIRGHSPRTRRTAHAATHRMVSHVLRPQRGLVAAGHTSTARRRTIATSARPPTGQVCLQSGVQRPWHAKRSSKGTAVRTGVERAVHEVGLRVHRAPPCVEAALAQAVCGPRSCIVARTSSTQTARAQCWRHTTAYTRERDARCARAGQRPWVGRRFLVGARLCVARSNSSHPPPCLGAEPRRQCGSRKCWATHIINKHRTYDQNNESRSTNATSSAIVCPGQ